MVYFKVVFKLKDDLKVTLGEFTVVKHFWISCAHFLKNVDRCENLHGHNYKITFCLKGKKLDQNDMLLDFREVKRTVKETFDHKCLNDLSIFKKGNFLPTTEMFAKVIFDTINNLCKMKENAPLLKWVEVEETDEVYVRYEEF